MGFRNATSSTCSSLSRANAKIVVVWNRAETRFKCALTLKAGSEGPRTKKWHGGWYPVLATLVCRVLAMTTYNLDAPVLDTYQAVVSAFCDFLTVAIHTILYERNIYPQTSFLKARKYNHAVRQNRHPKVCKWIQDAVAAVEGEMLKVGAFNHDYC